MQKAFSWLKIEHWYHVFVLLGAAGFATALVFDLKGIANAHALLLFGGVFFVGIGEWINHPLQTKLMAPNVYAPGGGKITGHPRNPTVLGTLFTVLGIALMGLAIYKIAQVARGSEPRSARFPAELQPRA